MKDKDLENHQSTIFGNNEIDFSDLIGSKIIAVGFHPDAKEGGLGVDYLKDGVKKRIVLGFTELGMWIQWQGKL